MKKSIQGSILCAAFFLLSPTAQADVLCKVKKTGAVIARPSVCTKKETAIATLSTTSSTASAAADLTVGSDITLSDIGAVSSGVDTTIGLDLSVNRLNAVGGSINTTGLNVGVVGDAGGDSTAVGLSVQTSGADTNYCALFQGGNVGINVSDPDEALEIAGRFHLGQSSAPGDVADKLYNVGGTLFWGGQQVGLQTNSDGKISSVIAGTGLVGGGGTGDVTLSVDTGTAPGKIVQLNSSAELPSVSGANLTSLNAGNLSSGVIPDARLSSNVSLLGSQVSLSGEVTGVLPVANGGIGASSLSNLISLGSHTTGDYVSTLSSGTGISLTPSGSGEGVSMTVALDSTTTPTWTGVHSFQSGMNVGTTTNSTEQLHLNGRLHIEPSTAPSTTTDRLYNVGGSLFFNGLNLSTNAAGGDITAVNAGTGLTGGATSGAVTLAVDVGTGANDIVQLNGSSQLPAVSGVNLTALNATNLTSGTIPVGRLPASVSQLGTSIDLTSEVTGVLPVASGGIGATSLNNLITLATHTTGNYLTALTAGSGISVANAGTEAITPTVSIDQSFTPSWSGTHTFSGPTIDITTGVNEHFAIMPNGQGNVGIGTTSPTSLLHTLSTSTSNTASSVVGNLFQMSDTGTISSGTDSSTASQISLTRTGSTGGDVSGTGLDIDVTSDTGGAGATTATGIDVTVSGADTNYAALFNGGFVGMGTTTPSATLDTVSLFNSATAGIQNGNEFTITDSGALTTGSDTTRGLDLNIIRSGATGGTIATTGLDISVTDDGGGTSTATALVASATGGDNNYAALFTDGRVGIGTSTPTSLFHSFADFTAGASTADLITSNRLEVRDAGAVTMGADTNTAALISVNRTGATGGTINSNGLQITLTGDSAGAGDSTFTGLDVSVAGADSNIAARFSGGQVGIGASTATLTDTDIAPGSLVIGNGALCVDNADDDCATASRVAGTIYAETTAVTGIDLAEEFPIKDGDTVTAGDIVVAATELGDKCVKRVRGVSGDFECQEYQRGNIPFVTRSSGTSGESKRVLGVVSTEPGVVLGGYGRAELFKYRTVPLALAGRIPVKVSNENGPLEVGDRITTSSTPGVGRKANEGELVVGIALEPFDADLGEVLTLVK